MGKKTKHREQIPQTVQVEGARPVAGLQASLRSADAEGPDGLPPQSKAPLALDTLSADLLGAFFELCFPDKRLLALCHELGLTTPGYRLEALPPDQVARVLAGEYLAAEDVRAPLSNAVREALHSPVLETMATDGTLTVDHLETMLDLLAGDAITQCGRLAWSALLSPEEAVRAHVQVVLQDGLDAIDVLAQSQRQVKPNRAVSPGKKEALQAVKRAERAEREVEGLKGQLAQARADLAQREQRLSEERIELERARTEGSRVTGELSRLHAAGEGRALSDARRLSDENRALTEKLHRAVDEGTELTAKVQGLEKELAARVVPVVPVVPEAEELPSEEEAAEFLVPVLTREFYDSIARWSRRMQRAAFDKIHRLANDWRHGSLRALELGGVPGYYRIRVATDVRLIYRRDGNRLEILSLIDREDLDRYVKQARTRPG